MNIKIINKSDFALPKYETALSAGMDLQANLKNKDDATPFSISIPPGERVLVKTGIFLEIPEGFEAQIRPRSGLAIKQGLTVLNAPGTIDPDYRGEIGVILVNLNSTFINIEHGDKIAQMVFAPFTRVTLEEVQELTSTERGQGGFGSTDAK